MKLQGETLLHEFNIIAAAGNVRQAINRDLKLDVTETFTLELIPSRTSERAPILSGIEIVSE